MDETQSLIFTVLVVCVFVVVQWIRNRKKRASDPEHELEELERKKDKIKIKSQEDRVIKRKAMNLYFLGGVICSVVWWLLLFPEFLRKGVDPWLWAIIVLAIDIHLIIMSAYNVSQVLGCSALRVKQKVVGGRTKPYTMYVGPHFPAKESYLRQKLQVLQEEPDIPPIIGMDGVVTAGDHVDVVWETKTGNVRRDYLPKNDLEVLDNLSYVNFKECLKFIDKIVKRQLGNSFHISHLPADSLRTRAENLAFDKVDIDMMAQLWTGIHAQNPDVHKALNEAMAQLNFDLKEDPNTTVFKEQIEQGLPVLEEQLRTQAIQERTEELFLWTLTERFGIDKTVAKPFMESLSTNGNKLNQLNPLPRMREEGIVFGGLHAEICRVYRYDTPWVIVLTAYPWEEAFSFRDRDWMDVPGFAMPMPYTDFDFVLLGTVIIQTGPKVYEPCNLILPIYTDKDLGNQNSLMHPHPIDKWTNLEVQTLFVEQAADPLARDNIRLKGKLQQKEQLQESQDALAMAAVKKLWRVLHTTRQMLQAVLPIVAAVAVIVGFVAFFLGQWQGGREAQELIDLLKNEIEILRGTQ